MSANTTEPSDPLSAVSSGSSDSGSAEAGQMPNTAPASGDVPSVFTSTTDPRLSVLATSPRSTDSWELLTIFAEYTVSTARHIGEGHHAV